MLNPSTTLGDILEAMKKNGYPKAEEAYFINKNEEELIDTEDLQILDKEDVVAACAAGTAAINLDMIALAGDMENFLNAYLFHPSIMGFSAISELNDGTMLTIPEIADLLIARAQELSLLNTPFDSE